MEKIGNIGWFLTDEECNRIISTLKAASDTIEMAADILQSGVKKKEETYTGKEGVVDIPIPHCDKCPLNKPWKNPADWTWKPWEAPWYVGDPRPDRELRIGDPVWPGYDTTYDTWRKWNHTSTHPDLVEETNTCDPNPNAVKQTTTTGKDGQH